MKAFFIRSLMTFLILSALITAGIAVLGLLLDPEARFGYGAFFSPFVFALLGTLPGMVMYTDKALTTRELLLRKAVQLLLIEAEVIALAVYSTNIPTEKPGTIAALAVSVAAVYAAMHGIEYLNTCREAREMTAALKDFQERHMR